jgi:hypothetical protein
MAAEAYQPFRENMGTIHTDVPDVVHVDFLPERGVSAALSAPVTEVATFYYDEAPPRDCVRGGENAH